jgi:hypothetical protein
VAGLAAALAIAALVYARTVRPPEPVPDPTPVAQAKVVLDAALAPLQQELVALTDDASALAGAVWQGVPRPLRELLRQ